jgi:hypothetical protein
MEYDDGTLPNIVDVFGCEKLKLVLFFFSYLKAKKLKKKNFRGFLIFFISMMKQF